MAIPDLNLLKLSLWLADWKGDPFVALILGAAIGSVRKDELVPTSVGFFINCHEVVIVAELLDSREVFVLLAVLEWRLRIRVFPKQKLGDLALQNASEDISGQLAQLGRPFLLQLDYCKDIAIFDFSQPVKLVDVDDLWRFSENISGGFDHLIYSRLLNLII